MSTILYCLEQFDPGRRGVTASEVVEKLKDPPMLAPDWYADLRAAFEDLCGGLDTRKIGAEHGRTAMIGRKCFDATWKP